MENDVSEVPKRNLAALFGNGVSVGFNSALKLDNITKEVLERFEASTAENHGVSEALKEIASFSFQNQDSVEEDFEQLVGAFNNDFLNIQKIRSLSKAFSTQPEQIDAAIETIQSFAAEIRYRAISHILEVIFERSFSPNDSGNLHHQYVQTIIDEFKGPIVFGNLNYDTLLLSSLSLLVPYQFCDSAFGTKIRVQAGNQNFQGHLLRKSKNDFLPLEDRRIRLLQLHGSLTYWASKDNETIIKIPTDSLRNLDQWSSLRDNPKTSKPVVVLTHQEAKTKLVKEYPFSLSYELFGEGLELAGHWLISGYSFKDQSANELLRSTYRKLSTKPKVLVVTLGNQLSNELVYETFGEDFTSSLNIQISRTGVSEMKHSAEWRSFIAK